MEDVRWLGFDWEDRLFYASDYFEQLYEWAVQLIKDGKAYVCDLTADEVRETPRHAHRSRARTARTATARSRRTSTCSSGCGPASSPTARGRCGRRSTWPRRTSTCATRCMYRILHATHHRTGDKWCIYPMYDFAHGQSRLDRGDHALDLHAGVREPSAAVRLVHREAGHLPPAADRVRPAQPDLHGDEQAAAAWNWCRRSIVSGWDDPRMPTICGLRRRGYTPEAIRDFCAADRRGEGRQRDRHGPAGALRPRGPEQAGRRG